MFLSFGNSVRSFVKNENIFLQIEETKTLNAGKNEEEYENADVFVIKTYKYVIISIRDEYSGKILIIDENGNLFQEIQVFESTHVSITENGMIWYESKDTSGLIIFDARNGALYEEINFENSDDEDDYSDYINDNLENDNWTIENHILNINNTIKIFLKDKKIVFKI
jgi:hypothetical protein